MDCPHGRGVMLLAFLAVFLALNPVYWCDPLGTLSAVVAERQRLMGDQVQALHSAAPMSVLDSASQTADGSVV